MFLVTATHADISYSVGHGLIVPSVNAQTVETKRVMQQKLAQSQQLLGALVTSNRMALSQRTSALQALTSQPGWQVLTIHVSLNVDQD